MMMDKEAAEEVLEILAPADFEMDRNRIVFSCLRDRYLSNDPVDLPLVAGDLDKHGDLARIGGGEYLTEAICSVGTCLHAKDYARAVKDASTLRILIRGCGKVVEHCYERDLELKELVEFAERTIYSVSDK